MRGSVSQLYLPLLLAALAIAGLIVYARATRLVGRRQTRALRQPASRRFRGAQARPGYVWFADVPFDEGGGSKDRPCLVVRTGPRAALVLKVTSQDKRGRTNYTRIATQTWDGNADHDSYLELYPLRELSYAAFRRPAGPCERKLWAQVVKLHRAAD